MPTSIWNALTARLTGRVTPQPRHPASQSSTTIITGNFATARPVSTHPHCPPSPPCLPAQGPVWEQLTTVERNTVVEYFGASIQLVQLFDAIRLRRRASDAEQVLEAYKQAEFKLLWMGLRTVFPPAVRALNSCEPALLERKGFLQRAQEGESTVRYAPAMVRHLNNLRKQFQPCELDSNWTHDPGW